METKQFGAKTSQAGYLTTLNISSRKKRLVALYIYIEIFIVANVGSIKHTLFPHGPFINNADSFWNCLVKRSTDQKRKLKL